MVNENGKLLNFRPIVLICAILIIGILLTVTQCYGKGLFTFLSCAFIILLISFIIYFAVLKNKKVYITLIVSLILTLLVCFILASKIFVNLNTSSLGYQTVYCEIISVNSITETDDGYLISTFVKVLQGDYKGEVIKTYFDTNCLLFEGYKIKFGGQIDANKIYSNGYFDYKLLKYGANYACYNSEVISLDTKITNVFFAIKNLLYNRLSSAGETNYEFIYALITGDTNFISDVTLNKFRDVGVAHIFAVSGLHIGFLFSFITLIFKPIKINKLVKYFLALILLYLYAKFCGLTASCLRAFIIIAVSSFSKTIGLKNDKLSSVFLSAILVLTLNPSDLFSVGFHLSYTACLSLIFITPKIEKLLDNIFPNSVSKFVAPFISAYLGTLPIIADAFSNSTAFSMLFNALIVPIMSFVFILCFVTSLLVLIFSKLLFLVHVASAFVGVVIFIVNTLSFIVFKVAIKFAVSKLFYYIGLTLYSGVINLKRKTVKAIQVTNFFVFLLVFLLINV